MAAVGASLAGGYGRGGWAGDGRSRQGGGAAGRAGRGGRLRATAAKIHGPFVPHADVQGPGYEQISEAQGQEWQHQQGQVQEQVVGPLVVQAVRGPLLPAFSKSCKKDNIFNPVRLEFKLRVLGLRQKVH